MYFNKMLLILLYLVTSFNLYTVRCDDEEDDGFGGKLIQQLSNDKNLDLPVDVEYEDLRAELLAYHTALANLTGKVMHRRHKRPSRRFNYRRNLKTTPCWKLGGICILRQLCIGPKYLSEVHGCKDKIHVCCFGWNNYNVRDFADVGIDNGLFKKKEIPFGMGQGVVSEYDQRRAGPQKVAIILEKIASTSSESKE